MGLIRLALMIGLVTFSVTGCGSSPTACTLLGCTDELTVTLSPAAVLPYSIDLTLDGIPSSLTCDAMGSHVLAGSAVVTLCDTAHFLLQGTPVNAEIHVTWADPGSGHDDEVSGTFTPIYSTIQPNGPTCQPSCRQTTVNLM